MLPVSGEGPARMVPTREIFWNIVEGWWIYPFAGLAIAVMALGMVRRIRLWRLGEPSNRLDRPGERLAGLLAEVFGQKRQFRYGYAGLSHALIFYGFFGFQVRSADEIPRTFAANLEEVDLAEVSNEAAACFFGSPDHYVYISRASRHLARSPGRVQLGFNFLHVQRSWHRLC